MELNILHRTEYRYSSSARDSVNEIKLRPRDTNTQKCVRSTLSTVPPASPVPFADLYGNRAHYVEISEPHDRLIIEARLRVKTSPAADFKKLPGSVPMSSLSRLKNRVECHPYLQASPYVDVNPKVWRQAVDIMGDSDDVFQTSFAIMKFIFREYTYQPGATRVNTHANEVIKNRKGVCQDFAHAMVAFCRSLKIPARYVSGYFFDATRDQSLRGSEATHAWVEVFVEGHGWIGLDPTNNKLIDDTYVVLAVGRDYTDVAPISGTYFGGGTSLLTVHVEVKRSKK